MKYKFDYKRVEYTRDEKIVDVVMFLIAVVSAILSVRLLSI